MLGPTAPPRWRVLLALLGGAGCGAPPAPAPPLGVALVAPDPALTVPPTAAAAPALAQASPQVAVQYLVDLLDAARLLGDGESRAFLWAQLGRPAGAERGETATHDALQALAERADRAGAASLSQLLDDDLEELDGGDALSVAARRRRIAGSDDPAAGHALLALYASCARPLADAAATVPWRRAAIANRCLYPLFAADPEPYFRRDPRERPPDPPWTRFIAGLTRLLGELRARAPRLRAVADRLDVERQRLVDAIELEGLAPPDVTRVAATLPVGDPSLPPYDRTPWVMVENDMAVVGRARFTTRDHALVERIDAVLTVQRVTGARGRVALFIPEAGSADVIDSLGALARRGGAETVELALAAPLTLRVPPDEVWADHPPSLRLVVLPLQLKPPSGRDLPRDVSARGTTITLLVAPDGITALASDGALGLGPIAGLAPRLSELRRAFPDEAQVALAIDPTATYRDVVATARAARAAFRQVALVDVPRHPWKDAFAPRVRRRAAARLVARGTGAAVDEARVAVLRGCYLDALDRDPTVGGAITILPGPPPRLADGGPSDAALRDCLTRRAAAIAGKVPITVELAPR